MMNTVRKSENLLPFPVISAAANGDTTAMCAILKHYEGYIAKLCTRTLKDDAGNTYSYVDEEMRNRLQVRLITRTLAFHVTEVWQNGRKHWLMPKNGSQSWTPFSSGSMRILFRENFLTSVSKSSPLTTRKSSISFKR